MMMMMTAYENSQRKIFQTWVDFAARPQEMNETKASDEDIMNMQESLV